MSTRKPQPRNRALRPSAEDLENRQLLSATVSGTDIDGDQWTLRLVGPGSLVVAKQPDANGDPSPLTSSTEIDTITIGGTDPLTSRIIGNVKKGANGDGKVFFQNLIELPNHSERLSGNGPLSISMPNFWLGNTTAASTTAATTPTPPLIKVPDGVATLVFGGVDTTHNQAATPPSTAASDVTAVTLGLPQYGGTRIIIDQSISSTQSVPPASGSTTPTTIQHAVTFSVSGRLDLFQANSIEGDAVNPPGQFATNTTGATGFGGTWVISGTAGVPPFLNDPTIQGAVTGQIGDLRIGGNATNLTALVFESPGVTGSNGDAKISNFSVGGETKNILVVAPSGARDLYFGHGMDQVEVRSHVIDSIQANRGALNSTIVSDRTISRAQFGGDVVNTNVITGVQQDFTTLINTVDGQKTVSPPFSTTPQPAPAPDPGGAQIGGGMTVLIAGDVTNSVFSASVQPGTPNPPNTTGPNFEFGTPQDLVIPGGHISAKVEGTIDNAIATPNQPTKAFYAQSIDRATGPVIPPNVPQAPYPGHPKPARLPGVHHVVTTSAAAANLNAQRLRDSVARVLHGASTPKGPAKG